MSQRTERNTLSRQWEILRLLPSGGVGITASELENKLTGLNFSVSKRTVERDLNELSRQFPLFCNDKSKPYGWRWMDNASFDIPKLSISDCVSLAMAEEVITPLLPPSVLRPLKPRFDYAKKYLREVSQSNALARWTDKVAIRSPSMPLLPPNIDEQVLETVQQALMDEKRISVIYAGIWTSESKTLQLSPLGLIQRGTVLYIAATAFDYSDVRLYALHRVKFIESELVKVNYPDNFTLEAYVESGAVEFGSHGAIKFRARMLRGIVDYLVETPLSKDMRIADVNGDEWLEVTATINYTWQFRWWLGSQGAGIEVIEPASLRESLVNEVKELSRIYHR